MKTKVLVTGAGGQLAKTIHEIYRNSSTIDFTFTTKDELDITKELIIEKYFRVNKFNYCINCAAYTNVEQAETDYDVAFEANALGVKNLALQCKNHQITLIHISTDYVFDGKKKTPYTEQDIPNPINKYGRSKLEGEYYVQEILKSYFIIRTSWLYSKFGKSFLKTIVQKIENNDHLKITTSQTGAPTSCADLSEFIVYLIENTISDFGIYNFSASGETNWYGYAMQICTHFKAYDCNKIEPIGMYKSQANRPDYSILDNKKARRYFNKEFLWRESVDKTVKTLIAGKYN